MTEIIPSWDHVSRSQQRHISVQRYFEISLLLMLATAFLTLASTGRLDTPSMVLFAAAVGVKLWSYARGESGYRLQPRTVSRLSFAYLFFFLFDLAYFAGGASALERMLAAAVHLILFVTAMKIFSARRYRDYGYLAALSFLMMLVSAILTAGAGYLLGLTLYVLFSISMFISYDIKRGTDRAEQPPRGPFREPVRNRVAMENSLALTALGLAAAIAVLGAVLFFVIPRYHASYLGNMALQGQAVTGFSESDNLGDLGRIKRSNLVVMRIRPQGDPSRFEGVAWRGIALSRFSGKTWYNEGSGTTRIGPSWPMRGLSHFVLPPPSGASRRPHRFLRYQVLLSSLSTDVLFAAAQPVSVDGRFPAIEVDETRSLHDFRPYAGPFQYTVVSDTGLPPPRALRHDSAAAPPGILEEDLGLPALDPRIAALARKITRSESNNYGRALAIQNYLRGNYGYTLNPPGIQPNDPVGSFLFVARKGYCVYFATAMAVMLRSLRIPARIVNGFETGEYNRVGGDFVVRARDAHSWVEVYFPAYGWVPFNPTPPSNEPAGAGWTTLDDYLDAFNLFWSDWVINYDFGRQAMLGQRMGHASHRLRGEARRWFASLRSRGAAFAAHAEKDFMNRKLLLLILATLFVSSVWLFPARPWLAELRFHAGMRLTRRNRAVTPKEAALTYRQFMNVLRRHGFRRSPSETPLEFARSLSLSPLGLPAAEFTRLYNALRFGHEPVSRETFLALLDKLSATSEESRYFRSG